jgi:hypothetical protein
MSDSLPPGEGPDPYEGQDLEGLLSGKDDSFPAGLRPVAQTLDALRAAPMRAELGGEAAARANFRKIMLGDGGGTWASDDSGGERTLILPVEASGVAPRPLQGRHRRRRPARRGNWQAKALAGAAAAAVVVIGVSALTGTFSGSGNQSAQSGTSPSATSATSPSTVPSSKGVEGSATQEPSRSSSPTASEQSGDGTVKPSELCREYYAPEEPLSLHDKRARFQQLSNLAGGPGHVYPYCLQFLQPWDAGSADQWDQGPHGTGWPPGRNGNGNQGKDESGSQGQNQQ